jgi:phosphatidylglycerophosphatase A
MKTTSEPGAAPDPQRKPRLAFAIATCFGLGYVPKAPGTFGALAGCVLTMSTVFLWWPFLFFITRWIIPAHWSGQAFEWMNRQAKSGFGPDLLVQLLPFFLLFLLVAALGVWSATRVAAYAGTEDPQYVIIDEVSGQQLTYLLGLIPFFLPSKVVSNPGFIGYGSFFALNVFKWKCLALGFILFRVFDIWKPFPIRKLEMLPGGWGIMADDWMAAAYAAILLQLALHFGVI